MGNRSFQESFYALVFAAEISPDGKKMASVGDIPRVYLFDTSSFGEYKKIDSFQSNQLENKITVITIKGEMAVSA